VIEFVLLRCAKRFWPVVTIVALDLPQLGQNPVCSPQEIDQGFGTHLHEFRWAPEVQSPNCGKIAPSKFPLYSLSSSLPQISSLATGVPYVYSYTAYRSYARACYKTWVPPLVRVPLSDGKTVPYSQYSPLKLGQQTWDLGF